MDDRFTKTLNKVKDVAGKTASGAADGLSALNSHSDSIANNEGVTDQGLGDVILEETKQKIESSAKDLAAKGADIATRPVRDQVKKGAKAVAKKVKKAAKKVAKNGVKAVKKLAKKTAGNAAKLIAAHPVAAAVIAIVLIILVVAIGALDPPDGNPAADGTDSMYDDELVVILMAECEEQDYAFVDSEADPEKEGFARLIYSVFRTYGYNDATVAGLLGNLDTESGLDSYAIEGIFTEYHTIGPIKAAAFLDISNYTQNTLFTKYAQQGMSINHDQYKVISGSNTNYYCGLGLAQWTGANAGILLSAAQTLGMQWYDMDFQLGYMLSDCIYRPGMLEAWRDNQPDDSPDGAREAAIYFADHYEGNTSSDEDRADLGEYWYGIVSGWGDGAVDQDYVDSIVALATDLGAIVTFADIADSQYECAKANIFDNSSLASAAVSLAWPTKEQSYNNGTNLYKTVLSTIWPDNSIYKACDRVAACAVRWSGTDDDFPFGTANQESYMATSPKWEFVGSADMLSVDDLLPGDIFIIGNAHVFIYVGSDLVQAFYPDEAHEGSDSVSGSIDERSAACDGSTSSVMDNGGQDWLGRGIYDVYRCTDPDRSTTYSSIGSGMAN